MEHTEDPVTVVREAMRVLRPGGIFQAKIPNFLSYFEGHYMVPQPPLFALWVLPAWVRLLGPLALAKNDPFVLVKSDHTKSTLGSRFGARQTRMKIY